MSIRVPENLSLTEKLVWLDGYQAALDDCKDVPIKTMPQGWRGGVQTDERYTSASNVDAE